MLPKLAMRSYHPVVLVYLVSLIVTGLLAGPVAAPQRAPTFATDIAPILYAHCVSVPSPGTSDVLQPLVVRRRASARDTNRRRHCGPHDAAVARRAT